MRAYEILNEVDTLRKDGTGVPSKQEITINIPMDVIKKEFARAANATQEEKRDEAEETAEDIEVDQQADGQEEVKVDPESKEADELDDIVRLAGGQNRQNHTIAQPPSNVLPDDPVYVSPLQQQLELQKQQGGKASPIINQILLHTDEDTGSTAGEQPEQSVYHDSPLKDNEWVGAGTGEVDNLANKTTTQGATKPWYKL